MNDDGSVSGATLHFANLVNDVRHGLVVGAVAARLPVVDVKLDDLVSLVRLGGGGGSCVILYEYESWSYRGGPLIYFTKVCAQK